jgi:hypothetical protein
LHAVSPTKDPQMGGILEEEAAHKPYTSQTPYNHKVRN